MAVEGQGVSVPHNGGWCAQLVCSISIAVFKARQGSASTQHPWEKDAGVLSRYRGQILARGPGMLWAQVRAQIKTPGQVST